jgi:hypothetical protein
MAVASPMYPDLQGSYQNIQNALSQGAQIAEKTPGPAGIVAGALAPIADEMQQDRELAYKGAIQDQLNRNEAYYQAQGQGKTFVTQDMVDNHMQKVAPNTGSQFTPQVGAGVMMTPDDMQGLIQKGVAQANIESVASKLDKQFPGGLNGDIYRASMRMGDTQGANSAAGFGMMTTHPDPVTGAPILYMNGRPIGRADQMFPGVFGGGNDPTQVNSWADLAKNPNGYKDLSKATEKFANDPQVSGYTKKMDLLNNINKTATENNPTAGTNVRAMLEQAVGNVPASRFSSKLLQSEGFSKAWSDQAVQWATSIGTGKLSDTNQKLILEQVASEKQFNQGLLNDKIDNESANYKDKYKLSDSFAKQAFSAGLSSYLSGGNSGGGKQQIILQDKQGNKFTLNDPSKLQDKLKNGYTQVSANGQ